MIGSKTALVTSPTRSALHHPWRSSHFSIDATQRDSNKRTITSAKRLCRNRAFLLNCEFSSLNLPHSRQAGIIWPYGTSHYGCTHCTAWRCSLTTAVGHSSQRSFVHGAAFTALPFSVGDLAS